MKLREISKSELAGAFVVCDPDWRKKIFFGGLLILLIHPIGWPTALGYRKALIANLASGSDPILPVWKGNVGHFFLEGLKAMGVIFGYLSPLYLALFNLLLSNGVQPNEYWLYTSLFFFCCTIFSTLSFPSILIYWTFFSEQYRVPLGIFALLLVAFSFVIFFIPAGFLQVSKSGRYLSAFNIPAAFSTLSSHFRAYIFAWYHSTLMSLSGHLVLPFAPWGVFWCYLGIIFEFNSILQDERASSSSRSWYQKLSGSNKLHLQSTDSNFVFRCASTTEKTPCLLVKLGPILIPLPKLIAGRLFKERS